MKRFPAIPGFKVPHIGWNQVRFTRNHPVVEGIQTGSEFYFVHSFYPAPADASVVLGETEYGGICFPSLLEHENIVACQFHAEKSGPFGLRLLKNFCAWNGKP